MSNLGIAGIILLTITPILWMAAISMHAAMKKPSLRKFDQKQYDAAMKAVGMCECKALEYLEGGYFSLYEDWLTKAERARKILNSMEKPSKAEPKGPTEPCPDAARPNEQKGYRA